MKNLNSLLLISAVVITMATPIRAQFTADMHIKTPEYERIYQVANNGKQYRYDFEEQGTKLTVLVNPEEEQTYILFPEQEFYQKVSSKSTTSLSNDPVQTMDYLIANYTLKKAGTEKVNGYECEKREIYAEDMLLNRNWYAKELSFPVKIVQMEQYTMELKNIDQTNPDDKLFKVPERYKEVDRQMRPVIPEPEAPETWNTKEKTVPFKEVFERGDQVEVTIKDTNYHKLTFINKGEEPSKVVRYMKRNGELLPENEQGPLSYRTIKLHPGEKKNLTLSLKPEDTMLLKVYFGKMEIDMRLE